MSETVENRTFDEIDIGDTASLTRTLRPEDAETWAAVAGNPNLMASAQEVGVTDAFEGAGAGGMWAAALISTVIGTRLPGLGSRTRSVNLEFTAPPVPGVEATATVTVKEKRAESGTIVLDCRVHAGGQDVLAATAVVEPPRHKIRAPLRELPSVQLRREDRYLELLKKCEGLEAMSTAVVHPCSEDALVGAIEAAQHDLIKPILVGPEAKIRATADKAGVDISAFPIVAAEHSHHAAVLAVQLVRSGEAHNLMKGSLHTDELLRAVLDREQGLRTERRLSHCFLLAVPTYERAIILTDAAINISPDLITKRDICQNAIDLAHALGYGDPKVAILAAVESVNPDMPATLDAAALCKMADRGQIKGGTLDGPLAFDNAVDADAARTKGIVSPVAGVADILVVPDLEAGNMLAKQLTFMANAEAAGIIVGARVPVVLTSRADSARTRLASCALSVLMAEAQRRGAALGKVAE
ncbi:MAG: bifunctional enoyl-CoA hydratase/phosphate acetyltransferase [Rhodospirillales bacterium]|nr:MAG: bifunctional enoyl-CoA hydratase/phosphate acetyltransferase [Rhodospirillales bacterium]